MRAVIEFIDMRIKDLSAKRNWYWRESNKDMPYKSTSKSDAKRRRSEFRKDYEEIKSIIKEFKLARKKLLTPTP